MAISPQRLTIYLYSAHRAVIFAIAQLSCLSIPLRVMCRPNAVIFVVLLSENKYHDDDDFTLILLCFSYCQLDAFCHHFNTVIVCMYRTAALLGATINRWCNSRLMAFTALLLTLWAYPSIRRVTISNRWYIFTSRYASGMQHFIWGLWVLG